MSTIDEEMKALADFAIKSARDRYQVELDYSDASISSLDKILEKIYWGFSSYTYDETNRTLVFETARIWGSYLGEFMRNKWGGEWIQKESPCLVLTNNIELSPINLVYQRITGNPNSSIMDYINRTQGIMFRVAVNPKQAQTATKKIGLLNKDRTIVPPRNPFKLAISEPAVPKPNKRLLYIFAGLGGISFIILAVVVISMIGKSGGPPVSEINPSATSTNTEILVVIGTTAIKSTETPLPTITTLPTYTPKPTKTQPPSNTPSPSPSLTPTNTPTPTITETEYYWRSPTPSRTPTKIEPGPQPTETPVWTPTRTQAPSPTIAASNTPEPTYTSAPPTEPPPVIESCDVNPSTVPAGNNTPLTFSVVFSAPGYSIIVINPEGMPGQAGCEAQDSDGDKVVSCDGSSGMQLPGTTVNVTIETPLGNCSVSYRTP